MGIKVIEQTSLKMALRSKPIILWTLGSMVLALSVLMILKLPNRDLDKLTCKRITPESGTCEIERQSWRGLETASITLNELRGAEVRRRVNVDSKGNRRTTTLLVLYTDKDYFPLTYNSTLSEKERIATRIDNFLANSQDTSLVETVEEVHIAKWVISSIVGFLGLVAILSDEVTWTFNKTTGKVNLLKRGIRGVRANTYLISQISSIQVEKRQRHNKEGKVFTDYRTSIFLISGMCLPLSGYENNIETQLLLANCIKQFLNL